MSPARAPDPQKCHLQTPHPKGSHEAQTQNFPALARSTWGAGSAAGGLSLGDVPSTQVCSKRHPTGTGKATSRVPTLLCSSANFPATHSALTPRAHAVCSQGNLQLPLPSLICFSFSAQSCQYPHFESLHQTHARTHTHTHTHTRHSQPRQREHTDKKPTKPRVGAGNPCHQLTVSPTSGRRPENPGQYTLQASPDISTLVRVPTLWKLVPQCIASGHCC